MAGSPDTISVTPPMPFPLVLFGGIAGALGRRISGGAVRNNCEMGIGKKEATVLTDAPLAISAEILSHGPVVFANSGEKFIPRARRITARIMCNRRHLRIRRLRHGGYIVGGAGSDFGGGGFHSPEVATRNRRRGVVAVRTSTSSGLLRNRRHLRGDNCEVGAGSGRRSGSD